MFIRSERLFLRPAWPEDWQELQPLLANGRVVGNFVRAPLDGGGCEVGRFAESPRDGLLPGFLMTVPGTHGARIIGGIGLERQGVDVELRYWIVDDDWGNGYAGEAVRAVAGLAPTLGHGRILASHFVDHPASGQALESAGFRRTGRVYERFSHARGMACPAREYALELNLPGGCDGTDGFGGESRRRAA